MSDNWEAILVLDLTFDSCNLDFGFWSLYLQFFIFTFGRCGYFVGINNNLLTDYWNNSRMGDNRSGRACGHRILEI